MHDRVLIKKIEQKTQTDSGLFVPNLVETTFEATVVQVGAGKPVKDSSPIPMSVKVGDRVMYNPAAAISVNVEGESLLVIKEEEIYLIID